MEAYVCVCIHYDLYINWYILIKKKGPQYLWAHSRNKKEICFSFSNLSIFLINLMWHRRKKEHEQEEGKVTK